MQVCIPIFCLSNFDERDHLPTVRNASADSVLSEKSLQHFSSKYLPLLQRTAQCLSLNPSPRLGRYAHKRPHLHATSNRSVNTRISASPPMTFLARTTISTVPRLRS